MSENTFKKLTLETGRLEEELAMLREAKTTMDACVE
jgi:hypothetical protein